MLFQGILLLCTVVGWATGYLLPSSSLSGFTEIKGRAAVKPVYGTVLYQQGRYILAFPQDDDDQSQRVALLRKLLDTLYQTLQPVLRDLNASTSSRAYDTFFHDEGSKAFLTTLFTNITTGAVTYAPTDPPQFWVPYSPTAAPIFWTVTKPQQVRVVQEGGIVDAFERCRSTPYLSAMNVFMPADPHPIIILCPYFYDAPAESGVGDVPPRSVEDGKPAANCLQVDAVTNRFKRMGNRRWHVGHELIMYRMWGLLEMLARKYYTVATGKEGMATPNVNSASRLLAKDALANGLNYVYYAASECLHASFNTRSRMSISFFRVGSILMQYRLSKGIAGNCKSFPRMRRRKNEIELLEVDVGGFPASVPDQDDDAPGTTVAEGTVVASRVQIGVNGVVVGDGPVRAKGKCAPGSVCIELTEIEAWQDTKDDVCLDFQKKASRKWHRERLKTDNDVTSENKIKE
ncbi:MAG: hypothetical protein Q9182_002755 [Xanthomendoza sp. 2 TL-2023]